ncbi:MAG TPA: ribonuclease Z [Paludibacteraceae bacterium]|nr:ribonuclease Z [Paludibacteraceae bacterium]HOU68514.1 ribonuclease Z [Paludibacteraceae bacterium]HPH63865.1 ribonuclease Z [Paludibacteraceae bacterium]HQF50354.1 ribonuclease Z [Paludibacteraceae bacterium]
MDSFHLHILGAGSALPTKSCNQPSQILSMREKSFMIDCGEGTQRQMRSDNVRISRLNNIFISHLHGDHCFGLIALISSLGMFNRTADLYIHAHPDLKKILSPLIDCFCEGMTYKVVFEPINPFKHELIYEDRSLSVYTIPLKHKMPTCGFLCSEKEKDRHIVREMVDFYKVPIREMQNIKRGADFVTEEGEMISNSRLTTDPTPSKKYAYCSDTIYTESIIPYIEGVDCLFHEATFLHADLIKAKATMHSTALQAATIAQKAKVKHLILGHYSARYEDLSPFLTEAQSVFPNTSLAMDGLSFDF